MFVTIVTLNGTNFATRFIINQLDPARLTGKLIFKHYMDED